MDLLFPLILLALMWLLLVRPQQQRVRRQRELVAALQVGDRILTAGGIFGTVVGLGDDEVRVEVAPGTVITMVRAGVSRRLVDDDEERQGGT